MSGREQLAWGDCGVGIRLTAVICADEWPKTKKMRRFHECCVDI